MVMLLLLLLVGGGCRKVEWRVIDTTKQRAPLGIVVGWGRRWGLWWWEKARRSINHNILKSLDTQLFVYNLLGEIIDPSRMFSYFIAADTSAINQSNNVVPCSLSPQLAWLLWHTQGHTLPVEDIVNLQLKHSWCKKYSTIYNSYTELKDRSESFLKLGIFVVTVWRERELW